MKYFAKILQSQRRSVKMDSQSDSGFDLIFLDETAYNQVMNRILYSLKRDIQVNLAWELKMRGSYKVYRNLKLDEIKDDYNEYWKTKGTRVSFKCDNIDYYCDNSFQVGQHVNRTDKKWKDGKILSRALKLSNINFEVN